MYTLSSNAIQLNTSTLLTLSFKDNILQCAQKNQLVMQNRETLKETTNIGNSHNTKIEWHPTNW